MPRPLQYAYDDDMAEREPLDNPHDQSSQSPLPPSPYQYQDLHHPYSDEPPLQTSPSRQGHGAARPGAHPDSSFERLRAQRRYSRDRPAVVGGGVELQQQQQQQQQEQQQQQQPQPYPGRPGAAPPNYRQPDPVSPLSPPQPPPHRDADGRHWGPQDPVHPPPRSQQPRPLSNITPGADNFSEAAAGGMAGIAYSVAERNARESGLEAMRAAPSYPQQTYHQQPQQLQEHPPPPPQQQQPPPPSTALPPPSSQPQPPWQGQGQAQGQGPWPARPYGGPVDVPNNRYSYGGGAMGVRPGDRDSRSSLSGLGPGPAGSGSSTTGSRSLHSFNNNNSGSEVYTDDPYQSYLRPQYPPDLGVVNPNEIEDDGDEGLEYGRKGARTSMLSLGGSSQRMRDSSAAAVGVAGGAAAAGGVMGALGGLVGRNSGQGALYDPVRNASSTGYLGGGGGGGGGLGGREEKSAWLEREHSRSKRKKKLAIIIVVLLIVAAAIACGIVFGVVLKKNHAGGSSGGSSSGSSGGKSDDGKELGRNSPEIKSLLNNPNLHKVFPGVDYTPLNTQFPDCLSNPPSQNNITRDVAVLSQLTNTIRLYGTDCNQTEMAVEAINRLEMQDTLKIWIGVWQDNNATTNKRQLDQMWRILDKYGDKPFKGVIVANEILFRQQMTAAALGELLDAVRTNITKKGLSLPVATSDLGDNWTAELAQSSDYIMANIHPFFSGTKASEAAAWTWDFWENNNGAYFKTDKSRNIIAETGWPSQGGTDCGTSQITVCPDGAVAGVDEMNRFMADWVCDALTNGTEYFWFEAFDEPWKVQFDQGSQNWEDHWGLMDVNRNLKKGVQIPDCGGKTVD